MVVIVKVRCLDLKAQKVSFIYSGGDAYQWRMLREVLRAMAPSPTRSVQSHDLYHIATHGVCTNYGE